MTDPCPDCPTHRVLATDPERNWKIEAHNERTVAVTVGSMGLLFTPSEFRGFSTLLDWAQMPVCDDAAYITGASWVARVCPHQQVAALRLDRCLLNLGLGEVCALASLCQAALHTAPPAGESAYQGPYSAN